MALTPPQTDQDKLDEAVELRGLAKDALKAAYKAQSYSVVGRAKNMADIKELKRQVGEYDRTIRKLLKEGIVVAYGVPG